MPSRLKLAITSVGSLVGQGILDSLEGRRHGLEVIGTNSAAEAAGNFRCDRAYLVPPAAERDACEARLVAILSAEKPHLVLAGRDDDVPILARLRGAAGVDGTVIPVGPEGLAVMFEDKWASFQFAAQHELAFVDSALAHDQPAVGRLVARHGYPLIAKPRKGHASRGVRIIFDASQLAVIQQRSGYLLQAYLQPEEGLESWRKLTDGGVPLFHAPSYRNVDCMAIIGPDGELRGLASVLIDVVMGHHVRMQWAEDPELTRVAKRWVECLAGLGWIGALNLQGRLGRDGSFQLFELNGRLGGGTASRWHFGFDELGLLIEAFTGRKLVSPDGDTARMVHKHPVPHPLRIADIETLQDAGYWRSAEA